MMTPSARDPFVYVQRLMLRAQGRRQLFATPQHCRLAYLAQCYNGRIPSLGTFRFCGRGLSTVPFQVGKRRRRSTRTPMALDALALADLHSFEPELETFRDLQPLLGACARAQHDALSRCCCGGICADTLCSGRGWLT